MSVTAEPAEPTTGPDPVRLASALTDSIRLMRRLVPAHGLSLTSLAMLALLERAGPARVGALADSEHLTQPAITQLVSRLQARGLVERHPDPGDGRVVLVALTAAGRRLLTDRRIARARALAERLATLSHDERAALAAALPALERLLTDRTVGSTTPSDQPRAPGRLG